MDPKGLKHIGTNVIKNINCVKCDSCVHLLVKFAEIKHVFLL